MTRETQRQNPAKASTHTLSRSGISATFAKLILLFTFATLFLASGAAAQSGGDRKGIIYGVSGNGDLVWHRHDGRLDGSFTWAYGNAEGNKIVGHGWNAFSQLFSGGDGVIYALSPNGNLNWYRHEGRWDGSFEWFRADAAVVGTGWNAYSNLFSGGDGIVYGVLSNGDLVWHRHEGRTDGTFRWTYGSAGAGNKVVGHGWNAFKHLIAGANGVIYGVTYQGEVLWYRHEGRTDGGFRWAQGSGNVIATGWNKYTKVFAGSDGVIYGLMENGNLIWQRHDGVADGSNRWTYRSDGGIVATGWNAYGLLFAGDESL